MNKIVCITGLPGSGKSTVSDFFVSKGYQYVRFGQVVLDEVKKMGVAPSEALEKEIRERMRKEHGMAAFAILNLQKFKQLVRKGNVIADGMYSFEEYKVMKKEFGEKCVVVAVYAPPSLRHKRISKRVMTKSDTDLRYRPFTIEEARSRDFAEIENLNKGGTIAMADYTILNTKTMDTFMKQVKEVYREIEKDKD